MMRSLIVYSSRTGNTKMIAEAIGKAIGPCDIHPVETAPSPDAYDFVAVGYWVDKGMPDSSCQTYMKTIRGKKIALFGTLGVDPSHDHARECAQKGESMVTEEGSENTVLGTFLCQGKIDPAVIEAMQKMTKDVHPMTPERIARIEAAKSHPDAEDCRKAQEAFSRFYAAANA